MSGQNKQSTERPKGFFASLFEKLDAKLKEKAEHGSCCSPKQEEKSKGHDKPTCCG